MLGSPPDLDNSAVVAAIRNVEGVHDVHHVHLWQMQENQAALDCHVVISDGASGEGVKTALKARLADEFGIQHSTLELEDLEHAHESAQLYGHKESEA